MTVHQLRRMTPAEDRLLSSAGEASADLSDARREAIVALRREGLPHRRVEAWHYTDLRSLLGQAVSDDGAPRTRETSVLPPLLSGSAVVDLGTSSGTSQPVAGLSIGVSDATPDWRRVVNHLDRDVDTIRLMATAFGATATEIAIADGTEIDRPIELRAEAGIASYVVCSVGAESRCVFVERLSPGHAALSSAVAELRIGDRADVLWIVDQAKAASESHLGQLNVTVGKDAVFRLFVLNAGGALVRLEVHTETTGEGADIRMRGVNLIEAGQHIDVTTTLNHSVANTTSTETFRNVVMGGHGVFQGMIKVSKGAQKTDARMACNTLLLSDDGDFSAKPELEIFADDVQCGHGATAGEIDANHLFYLMSRGIPEREARSLLVKAFVKEVVEELENDAAIEALEARIDDWLAAER